MTTPSSTALAARPNYVALGPIYPTILKSMKWEPQGLPRIGEWKRRVAPLPLVAIGGLTPQRIPGIFENGADAAAVVTDILRNPDPERRTREWIAATEAGRLGGPPLRAPRAPSLPPPARARNTGGWGHSVCVR